MADIPLETVQLAVLGAGAVEVKDGNVTETWKGTIFTASGSTVAYIKMLPSNQLISEVTCAVLGRVLNLNVPKPYLVKVKKTLLPKSKQWRKKETERICFASEDVGHPSMKRLVANQVAGVQDKLTQKYLRWDGFKDATIFDEWIANSDRNIGNLLFDGREFYLIDHSHAFTGSKWQMADLKPEAIVKNVWLDILNPILTWQERSQWKDQADLARLKYQCIPLDAIGEKTQANRYATVEQAAVVAQFIRKRADLILQLICSRLRIGLLPI